MSKTRNTEIYKYIARAAFASLLTICFQSDVIRAQENIGNIQNPLYGAWQNVSPSPVSFELIQTFGSEDNPAQGILLYLSKIIVDKNGNVYALDGRNDRLMSFAPDGALRWSNQRNGRGPGDLHSPYDMTWDREKALFVLNNRSSRVDEFDLEGNFIKSQALDNLGFYGATVIDFIEQDKFVFGSPITQIYAAQINVVDFSEKPTVLSDFKLSPSPDVKLPIGFYYTSEYTVIDGSIFLGSDHSYGFYVYDLDGQQQNKVTRNIDADVAPIVIDGTPPAPSTVMSLGSSGPPIKLNEDYYVQYNYWPTNLSNPTKYVENLLTTRKAPVPVKTRTSIDILNTDMELLYSYEYNSGDNNGIGKVMATDSEGFMYTVSYKPFVQIRKYKVSIKE